jgi:hypothetical protein
VVGRLNLDANGEFDSVRAKEDPQSINIKTNFE